MSFNSNLPDEFKGEEVVNGLQLANHLILGLEYDISSKIDFNIEGYIKDFTQLTNINKEKSFSTSPVTTSSNYEYEASNNPETNEELKILTKTKTEVSRKSLPNENSNVLRSKGFKVIKKLKD